MLMNHQIHLKDQIAVSEFTQPFYEFQATWKLANFRTEIGSAILTYFKTSQTYCDSGLNCADRW